MNQVEHRGRSIETAANKLVKINWLNRLKNGQNKLVESGIHGQNKMVESNWSRKTGQTN